MQQVLIIEKDELMAMQLADALEKAGYVAIQASDIKTGLRKLNDYHSNLVVFALEMYPERIEESLQQFRVATHVPLIVIGDAEDYLAVLELGADAYVTKPPDIREIVARVKALLRRKAGGNLPCGSSGIPFEAGAKESQSYRIIPLN